MGRSAQFWTGWGAGGIVVGSYNSHEEELIMPKYLYPEQPAAGGLVSLPGGGAEDRAFACTYSSSPALGTTTAVKTAVTDDGTEQTVTVFDGQPDAPRVLTATAGGTAGDVGAISVVVTGTDPSGEPLVETLPAFTVDTPGSVTSLNAFGSVTSVVIPAHDGTGATTAVGLGDALGLGGAFSTNPVVPGMSFFNGVVEGTEPTVAVNAAMPKNLITYNSTLDGSVATSVLIF